MERGRVSEVVAYSSGNHAQAVALVSKLLGVKATIVMPRDAPAAKLAATRGYGAEVVLYDRYGESRDEIGERLVEERGALLVPPFDDELIMAGAGTATAELLEEVPDLDFLVVPVSGGGPDRRLGDGGASTCARRSRSTASSRRPPTTRRCRSRKGSGSRSGVPRTIADGLQVPSPGKADVSDRPENRGAAFSSYPTRR